MKEVLLYYQPQCGPSKLMIRDINRSNLEVTKVDIRGCGNDIFKHEIKATPTVVLLEDNQVVKTYVGRNVKNYITDNIKEFMNDS